MQLCAIAVCAKAASVKQTQLCRMISTDSGTDHSYARREGRKDPPPPPTKKRENAAVVAPAL